MNSLLILIPTDFTETSEYALKMALKFSEQMHVDLHLIHVMQQSIDLNLDSEGNVLNDGETDSSEYQLLKEKAERDLAAVKQENDLVLDTHLMVGNITECIINKAKDLNADLILMGSRGVYRKRGILRGIETQYIVRKSPIPVLTVMCDRAEQDFKRVILVSDFKEKEKHHPEILKKLQMAFQMKLILLYVSDRSPHKLKEQKAKERMQEFASYHQLEIHEMQVFSDFTVQEGVNHFVQIHDTDLVCMATHGRPGWFKIFWSSIAEHISTHVYKPVLTYHLKAL